MEHPKLSTDEERQFWESRVSDLSKTFSLDEMRKRTEQRIAPQIPEKSEAERSYWHKVFVPSAHSSAPPVMRMLKEQPDYDEARRKFWAILQFRAATIETLEDRPFQWSFTDEEKEILKNLVRYFINDPESKYPLAKGLFVYGGTGTGKTEIMQALQKFADQEGLQKRFKWTNLSDTYTAAKTDKEFNPVIENVTMNRCFDEFGRYTGGVLRFGDSLDINEAIIEQRYARWKRYGQFSFFIANVTPNDLPNLVSPMLLDRIREMCTSVLFPGKSKRK